MRYGSSNPSSGDFYTVGDLLTGSGCGDYAAGTVSTSAGTCDGGSSTPSVTLTNTGTVTTYLMYSTRLEMGLGQHSLTARPSPQEIQKQSLCLSQL